MARYIDADALREELKSLSITVTGLRSGKGYLSQIVKEYKDSILRIIDEQPTADVAPKREVDRLEYTLLGVMHSVDKWLDGAELEQNEVNRAAVMREKTLNIIEGQQDEIRKLEKALRNSLPSYSQVISEEKAIELGKAYGRREVAREIFEEIQKIFVNRILHNESQYFEGVLDNITKDLDELKKKYTEEK